MNENGDLFIQFDTKTDQEGNSMKSYFRQVFRTHTELDLHQLKSINKQLEEGKADHIQEIDLETIVSMFGGHTIFSMYSDEMLVCE